VKAAPVGLLVLGLLTASPAASAFGAKTHLWVGNQIVGELRAGCTLTLNSNAYHVKPDLCEAILANVEAFNAGVLGPDVYPDLISGQGTTHSGVKDGWETARFLEHVVSSARTPESRAYSAGFLVHAAGDVFGHSYVNLYAGDVWNLGDETAVELRHAVIEKYIDAHLPPGAPGPSVVRAPAEFVRDTLVHSSETQPQYRRAGSARHLAAMTAVKTAVDRLATRSEALSATVSDTLAKTTELALSLAVQVVDGEAVLAAASTALEAPKALAEAQRAVVERERKSLADATVAADRHERNLTELDKRAQASRQAAAAANRAAQTALAAARGIRVQLAGLDERIQGVPAKVVVTVCHNVSDKVCDTVCPTESSNPVCALCNVPRQVCTAAERVNDEHRSLDEQITNARRELAGLESAAAAESARSNAATASAESLLRERATEEAAGPVIAATKTAAAAMHAAAVARYRSTLESVAALQRRVDDSRAGLAENRRQLVDARGRADQIRGMVTELNALSHVIHNWQNGVDQAGIALVRASERMGQASLAGGRFRLLAEYRRWLACEGSVYLAAPYQVADVPCVAATAVQQLQAALREIGVVVPAPLRDLYGALSDIESEIRGGLSTAIADASIELVRFVSDDATADFLDLLMNPGHATRAELDAVLGTADDAKGKEILVFANGADLIDRDIGLDNGVIDPNRFAALSSSVTLAKLSLLDQSESRRLVLEIGGPQALERYDAGNYDVGRSALIAAVRSLDGNEQWQPFGLPFPRSRGAGAPADARERHHGFGPRDQGRGGFPLFIDPVLRERVFLKLFPRQIHGEVVTRPEMAPGRFGFPICDGHPFPVTFLPDGEPALRDDGCASSAQSAQPR
jgi:hypothetical protein